MKTVTHIIGLRAFTSQLLCEQVVGRGLRRMSYELDENGLLNPPEYVTVLGVPFGFLPFEDVVNKPPDVPKPPREVRPIAGKAAHAIGWPVIEAVRRRTMDVICADVDSMEELALDAGPPAVDLAPVLDGHPAAPDAKLPRPRTHRQTAVFAVFGSLFSRYLREGWVRRHQNVANAKPYRIPLDILGVVEAFLDRRIRTGLVGERLYMAIDGQSRRIADHMAASLSRAETSDVDVPDVTGVCSTGSVKPYHTSSRRTMEPRKSHLNLMAAHAEFELDIGRALDTSPLVLSWVKADMVGFYVNYAEPSTGRTREYRPDFIIHLASGIQLVLEGKGEARDSDVKRRALDRWVRAVNGLESYGIWDHDTVWKTDSSDSWKRDLARILSRTRNPEISRECRGCAKRTEGLRESVEAFGLYKHGGLLLVNYVCRECRGDKIQT